MSRKKKKKYKAPQGTVAVIAIYVLLIVILWGSAYLTLLARGIVQ